MAQSYRFKPYDIKLLNWSWLGKRFDLEVAFLLKSSQVDLDGLENRSFNRATGQGHSPRLGKPKVRLSVSPLDPAEEGIPLGRGERVFFGDM